MIIASNNKNKIQQLKEILPNFSLVGLREYGIDIDVEENGKTFEENSYIKAKAIYDITKESVISDDSGLCIPIFDNWPGVETHRFLGDNSTARERNEYILNRMKKLNGKDRECISVCIITLIDKSGTVHTFRGELKGVVSREIRGFNTFGYDDIFELPDGKTMAELTNEEKYKLIARAKALNELKEFINNNPSVNI